MTTLIREYRNSDLDSVLDIWLEASVLAHDFIPASFWREQRQAMAEQYLPASHNWVLEQAGEVVGFISLYQQRVAALFVAPAAQGQALGKRLLNQAQQQHDELFLSVYSANQRAVRFYKANGFTIEREAVDPHTGAAELHMCWQRSGAA